MHFFSQQGIIREEERNQRGCKIAEPNFFLQWGNRKRLRCVRVKDPRISSRLNGIRRKLTATVDRSGVTTANDKESSHLHPNRLTRSSDGAILWSADGDNRKSASPEKEDRYYTTRGSTVAADEIGKVTGDGINGEERAHMWPKLYISLSSKEKEEAFLAMKGCKLPQRPKKWAIKKAQRIEGDGEHGKRFRLGRRRRRKESANILGKGLNSQ